jgi:hypothetical protein
MANVRGFMQMEAVPAEGKVVFVLMDLEGRKDSGELLGWLRKAGWSVRCIPSSLAGATQLLTAREPLVVRCGSDAETLNVAEGLVRAGEWIWFGTIVSGADERGLSLVL